MKEAKKDISFNRGELVSIFFLSFYSALQIEHSSLQNSGLEKDGE